MKRCFQRAVLVAAVVLLPALAHAQSITGVVRDASGAVLPGVTVEAASPALIEKVRTSISDGTGQYRIENLTPGTYKITYSLPGFTTVERDGVQVSTGVTLTLNADLRVGGVQESITVTGETPVVDVQNSTRVQRVLSDEVLAALPASRGYGNLLTTVSGIQANGTQNGGINPTMVFFTSRGGRSNEGTIQIDGMNVGSAFNGGGVAGYGYDTTNAQEVQLTVAGGLGEADRGGPQFNIVPKTGGNTFSGTYFGSLAGRVVARQQRRRHAEVVRDPGANQDHQELGHELLDGRADQAGPDLVLRRRTDVRRVHGHRRPLRELERGRPRAVGLRRRSEHQVAVGEQPEDRRHAGDRAAVGAEQGQRLLRLPDRRAPAARTPRTPMRAAYAATTGSGCTGSARGRRRRARSAMAPSTSCSSGTRRR